ncbi:MAG: hypothetical protein U0572_02800 [Phycisphaerales bacterium]
MSDHAHSQFDSAQSRARTDDRTVARPMSGAVFVLSLTTAVLTGYLLGNALPLPARAASEASNGPAAISPSGPSSTRFETTALARSDAPAGTTVTEVPGSMSDAELAAMSRPKLQALLGDISRARQVPGLDADTRQRLKSDFQRVLAMVKEAK